MSGNRDVLGSDLAKVDAYDNTVADYDEIPDMADADLSRVTWHVDREPMTEAEGRAAMAAAAKGRGRPTVNGGKDAIKLRIDRDVVAAFRATGPGWQGRINDALRKAAGL